MSMVRNSTTIPMRDSAAEERITQAAHALCSILRPLPEELVKYVQLQSVLNHADSVRGVCLALPATMYQKLPFQHLEQLESPRWTRDEQSQDWALTLLHPDAPQPAAVSRSLDLNRRLSPWRWCPWMIASAVLGVWVGVNHFARVWPGGQVGFGLAFLVSLYMLFHLRIGQIAAPILEWREATGSWSDPNDKMRSAFYRWRYDRLLRLNGVDLEARASSMPEPRARVLSWFVNAWGIGAVFYDPPSDAEVIEALRDERPNFLFVPPGTPRSATLLGVKRAGIWVDWSDDHGLPFTPRSDEQPVAGA